MNRLGGRSILVAAVMCGALSAPVPAASAAQSNGIVATVNGFAISDFDLDQRVTLFSVLNGMPVTDDTRAKIRAQVLNDLEDEVVEIQEGTKQKISVTNEEISQAFQGLAGASHVPPQKILDAVKQAGINAMVLGQQIAAALIWRKLIGGRFKADALSAAEMDEAARTYLSELRRNAVITTR